MGRSESEMRSAKREGQEWTLSSPHAEEKGTEQTDKSTDAIMSRLKKYVESRKATEQGHISIDAGLARLKEYVSAGSGAITATPDGGCILNPKSTFPLTVFGIDKEGAEEFKRLLEETSYSQKDAVVNVLHFIARANIRCKEIEDYIREFKPRYLAKVEELKRSSSQWRSASDYDRDDLLAAFREEAIESLDLRPDCNLPDLFEGEPINTTVLGDFIRSAGYENVQRYFKYAVEADAVQVIPDNHPERLGFKKLVELELAVRGDEIPMPDVLSTLRFSNMRELVSDLKPALRNKAQAIQFLSKLPDIRERLGRTVIFQDLFKPKPLEDEIAGVNLGRIFAAWKYLHEITWLIVDTYGKGNHAAMGPVEILGTGWELAVEADACPYCRRASRKNFSREHPPTVPLHIGCRCEVVEK